MDPFGILTAFMEVQCAWKDYPRELLKIQTAFVHRLLGANMEELRRLIPPDDSVPDNNRKKADFLDTIKQSAQFAKRCHSLYQDWLVELVEKAPGVPDREKDRAAFWAKIFINALSPSNLFWTNAAAIQRFMDSRGESLAKGLRYWMEDLQQGRVLLRMVDEDAFQIGENIATTPGQVVFRNDLMELIQYEPSTVTTYPNPVVFIQPWINKFYIFDLTPQMSFVRYLRDRGFTVFIISWKNPTCLMREVTFDDYMLDGALQAIQVARAVCRNARVHAAGYCIGGTVLAALMAWLNKESPRRRQTFPVVDWTLFSSLVDFSEPGELGFFVTPRSVETIEEMMKKDGYLSEKFIELAFRILGSDGLIWRNFVQSFLYGMAPPKSDILFWNSDSTRLPEAMCSFYLREFYLNNRLVKKDELCIGGRSLDLARIHQPLYAVSPQTDHICPWKSTFKICNLVSGPVKYVLSTEGHITGIVNPPSETTRRRFWAGETAGEANPDLWLNRQEERHGSWWEDWTQWLIERSQSQRRPPSMGNRRYPPIEKAPGSYVTERPEAR